jgi:RNA polymerase sigma factor (sigma-70 family)
MADDSTTKLQGLLNRLAVGDCAACDELIARAHGGVHRLVRRMYRNFPSLRPYDDTTDNLHQCFPRLRRTLDVAPRGTVSHFFGLAAREMRRGLLDLVDRYYRPVGPGDKHAPQPLVDDSSCPLQETYQDSPGSSNPLELARWTEFHRAVEALPVWEREVFSLIWYFELTQAETAAILNCTEISARRHLVDARRQLGAVLRISPALQ